MRRPGARSGFTLLEVLAALTLASLVLAMGAASLSGASDQARFDQVRGRLCDLDQRGRLYARARGAAALTAEENGQGQEGFVLRTWPGGEPLAEAFFDRSLHVSLRDGEARGWVLFDRSGRSCDYDLRLRAGDRRARWRVSGATGWVVEEEGR